MKKISRIAGILLLVCNLQLLAQKQIAITIDDLPFVSELSLPHAQESTQKLLQKIKKHHIQAVGFVNEIAVVKIGEIDARVKLLEDWLKNGNELGSHMFSHPSFNTTSLEDYKTDFLKGEIITEQLNKKYKREKRYFRYPFLQTGPDSLKKYGFEAFLKQKGYENAPVTIEADDWYFNKVYMDAMKANNKALMKSIAEKYLKHTADYFDYYEKYTQEVFGRPIKHIFLCHVNALNADYFDELANIMTNRGYSFVTLEEALKDDIYKHPDTTVTKGGFSWLHRWRITDKKKISLPEVEIPADIKALYEAK